MFITLALYQLAPPKLRVCWSGRRLEDKKNKIKAFRRNILCKDVKFAKDVSLIHCIGKPDVRYFSDMPKN